MRERTLGLMGLGFVLGCGPASVTAPPALDAATTGEAVEGVQCSAIRRGDRDRAAECHARGRNAQVAGSCPAGSAWVDGQCVQTKVAKIECPPGTELEDSVCAAKVDETCPPGQFFEQGKGCVDIARDLTMSEIHAVVSRSKPGVTRACWSHAKTNPRADAPDKVKLSVTIKVGPKGSITNATATGADATYPELARCVVNQIKSWQFPPSENGANINIPFGFGIDG